MDVMNPSITKLDPPPVLEVKGQTLPNWLVCVKRLALYCIGSCGSWLQSVRVAQSGVVRMFVSLFLLSLCVCMCVCVCVCVCVCAVDSDDDHESDQSDVCEKMVVHV